MQPHPRSTPKQPTEPRPAEHPPRAERKYADALPAGPVRGRAAGLNPGNRFEGLRLHVLGEALDDAAADGAERTRNVATAVLHDDARTIINYVDPTLSPDIGFRWTINPYRGCEHGCVYCYARPTHETLGFSCGLDFETRIMAKHDAPRMLRRELARPSWKPETIMMSGVTDCYQPLEAELRLTRGCMEVLAECRQPVSVVTKSRLVVRDLDLLTELAKHRAAQVAVSITTLDNHLAAKMEPRASAPRERLEAVAKLRAAGVPVAVMVAPVVPALTDRELPAILKAAADAGAQTAGYVLLRLPHQVKALFLDWLARYFPDRAGHVETLLREARGGKLYEAIPGRRMRGQGAVAEQINGVFKVFSRRYGLDGSLPPLSGDAFCPPAEGGQMRLFT